MDTILKFEEFLLNENRKRHIPKDIRKKVMAFLKKIDTDKIKGLVKNILKNKDNSVSESKKTPKLDIKKVTKFFFDRIDFSMDDKYLDDINDAIISFTKFARDEFKKLKSDETIFITFASMIYWAYFCYSGDEKFLKRNDILEYLFYAALPAKYNDLPVVDDDEDKDEEKQRGLFSYFTDYFEEELSTSEILPNIKKLEKKVDEMGK
jgi:hypothetical protein